jgi:superoxide dismutase, Cu-Zn family
MSMREKQLILLSMCALLLSGCSSSEDRGIAAEATEVNTRMATVTVHPTEGNHVSGKVAFIAEENGVRIIADITGLKPGKHGFHVHEHGDCSAADASSAGGHFNPTGKKHGGPDSEERHVGDFGNLEADGTGVAHYDRLDKVIQLSGPNSIVGKSIIIHADADDLVSQPSGNSGARVACGIIEAIE